MSRKLDYSKVTPPQRAASKAQRAMIRRLERECGLTYHLSHSRMSRDEASAAITFLQGQRGRRADDPG